MGRIGRGLSGAPGTYEHKGGTPASPDVPDPPCEICGLDPASDCDCPECGICGAAGDPRCYIEHRLERLPMAGFWWFVMVQWRALDGPKWSCWSRGRNIGRACNMQRFVNERMRGRRAIIVEAQNADHARYKIEQLEGS